MRDIAKKTPQELLSYGEELAARDHYATPEVAKVAAAEAMLHLLGKIPPVYVSHDLIRRYEGMIGPTVVRLKKKRRERDRLNSEFPAGTPVDRRGTSWPA
jgi:hypothetical protein